MIECKSRLHGVGRVLALTPSDSNCGNGQEGRIVNKSFQGVLIRGVLLSIHHLTLVEMLSIFGEQQKLEHYSKSRIHIYVTMHA